MLSYCLCRVFHEKEKVLDRAFEVDSSWVRFAVAARLAGLAWPELGIQQGNGICIGNGNGNSNGIGEWNWERVSDRL